MTNKEVTEKVKTGYRMSQPEKCPDAVYQLMEGCWYENPTDRSTFEFLFQKLCTLRSRDNSKNSDDDEGTTYELPDDNEEIYDVGLYESDESVYS